MIYALVNGQRQDAQPDLTGECPACGSPVIPHCGERKVWHWAHKGRRHCDPWWENEGPWHREWKSHFPVEWQEFVQRSDHGEKHIADVRTDRGWVLEFQHSYLNPEERRSRDAFYGPKLIWVVNALRRQTDLTQFNKEMERPRHVGVIGEPFWVGSSGSCRLAEEWSGSDAQVLFDFGPKLGLMWMLGRLSNGQVFFARYTHAQFIEAHGAVEAEKDTDFAALVEQLGTLVEEYERIVRSRSTVRFQPQLPASRRSTPRRRRRF